MAKAPTAPARTPTRTSVSRVSPTVETVETSIKAISESISAKMKAGGELAEAELDALYSARLELRAIQRNRLARGVGATEQPGGDTGPHDDEGDEEPAATEAKAKGKK